MNKNKAKKLIPIYIKYRRRRGVMNEEAYILDHYEKYKAALEEIANEKEIHTKLNQERLCCKFQHIAINALDS